MEFCLRISNYQFSAKSVSVDAQYGPQTTMNNWITGVTRLYLRSLCLRVCLPGFRHCDSILWVSTYRLNNSWMTSNVFSTHEPYSISTKHFKPWLNVCYLSHHLVSGRWQWPKTFMKLTYIWSVQNQMWFVASSIGRDLTRPDT